MRNKMKFFKPLLVTLFTLVLTTGFFHDALGTAAASGNPAIENGCAPCEIDPEYNDYTN